MNNTKSSFIYYKKIYIAAILFFIYTLFLNLIISKFIGIKLPLIFSTIFFNSLNTLLCMTMINGFVFKANKFRKEQLEVERDLSVWGYFWRAYIIHYFTGILLYIVLVSLFSPYINVAEFSPSKSILINMMHFFFCGIVIFLMFSKNKVK